MTVVAIVFALGLIVWIISVAREGGKDSAKADQLDEERRGNTALEKDLEIIRKRQHIEMASVRDGDDADRMRNIGRD